MRFYTAALPVIEFDLPISLSDDWFGCWSENGLVRFFIELFAFRS